MIAAAATELVGALRKTNADWLSKAPAWEVRSSRIAGDELATGKGKGKERAREEVGLEGDGMRVEEDEVVELDPAEREPQAEEHEMDVDIEVRVTDGSYPTLARLLLSLLTSLLLTRRTPQQLRHHHEPLAAFVILSSLTKDVKSSTRAASFSQPTVISPICSHLKYLARLTILTKGRLLASASSELVVELVYSIPLSL